MSLCDYKDILGEPGKGLHSYRIYNLAIVDILLTFLAAYIFYYYFNDGYEYNYFVYLICFFIIGIVLHRIFCVKTTVDMLLFGK